MKKTLIATFLVTSLFVGGCATFQSLIGGGSVADANQSAIMSAEKGLTVAHLAYQAIGVTLQSEAQSGALHGATAASAQQLYDKAGAALDAADQADVTANAQGVADAVAQAEALIAQISSMIPQTPHK